MSESILQRRTLQAGDRIFKIIDGVETVLGKVGQGGIFGEMAAIDCKPHRPAPERVNCLNGEAGQSLGHEHRKTRAG